MAKKLDLSDASKSLHDKIIPSMTNTIMDAFELGVETGCKITKEAMTNRACWWLSQLKVESRGRVTNAISEELMEQFRSAMISDNM